MDGFEGDFVGESGGMGISWVWRVEERYIWEGEPILGFFAGAGRSPIDLCLPVSPSPSF